jgi:hypothetical protein
MRASAQVTAPGAITSMIVAVSTRPNGQNRSTRSRMSVPLVQNQMLSPVNHSARRSRPSRSALVVGRPRRDRYDDHRQRKNHREPKSETIWCPRHLFPSWLPVPWGQYPRPSFRGANRERCVSYFTLRIIGILMETIKDLYIRGGERVPIWIPGPN